MSNKTRTNKEGRVNIPLGRHKARLRAIAKGAGTTETNVARVLILEGLAAIESGTAKFTGPTLLTETPTAA